MLTIRHMTEMSLQMHKRVDDVQLIVRICSKHTSHCSKSQQILHSLPSVVKTQVEPVSKAAEYPYITLTAPPDYCHNVPASGA